VTTLIGFYIFSLIVSSFLSMFEVAILTINPVKLDKLCSEKPYLAFFEKKKDKAALNLMSFNFLFDIGVAMALSVLIAQEFPDNPTHTLIASILTALGTLYIATLGAKMFASKKSDVVIKNLGWLIVTTYWVTKPLMMILTAPALMILQAAFGKDSTSKLSDSELLGVLAMAQREGLLAARQHMLIKRVISLQNQTVKDILPKDQVIESVDIEDSILNLKDKIEKGCHKRIIVTKTHNDKAFPIGILLFKDIVRAYVENLESKYSGDNEICIVPTIASVMHPCVVTKESEPADVLMTKLDKDDHIVVAIDNDGVICGLMQSDDIISALTR
jgi:CBS domain containing-hemolysin-like protein